MPRQNDSQAIEQFVKILGREKVFTDEARLREAQSATFNTSQTILGILKPHNVEEIQDVVRIARESKVPLYTISTGKNWGYGSRIPIQDGSFLLELSGLHGILDYSEELGYVTVEPGVTQKQLYAFLRKKKSRFSLSTTGSAPDTSIIGNICERGVGMGPYNFRAHYISALEVILPSGECIHTGYGRFGNAQAARVYPDGVGPDFTDMFIQSNFGIITKLTLLLAPTPVYSQLIDLFVSEEKNLPVFLELARTFNFFTNARKGISFHNDAQMLAAMTQYPWNVTDKTPLPANVATQLKKKYNIAYAWRGVAEVYGHTIQEVTAQVDYFTSLAGKLEGVEVSQLYNDNTLNDQPSNIGRSIYWRMKTKPPRTKNPDADGCGNIRLSMAVPFTARNIAEVVATMKKTITQSGYEPFIEIHCIAERSVIVVASLVFDRTKYGEDAAALHCHDTLLNALMKLGYYPYRLNVRAMTLIPKSTDEYDNFQKIIKRSLDPDNIFSPGRYEVDD